MENNKKNELQLNGLKKALSNPMDGKALSGALPDDALEGVAGGAVLDSSFYIAKCNRCGWQSCPFDNRCDFVNITLHNFLQKTSFLDHHQNSLRFAL